MGLDCKNYWKSYIDSAGREEDIQDEAILPHGGVGPAGAGRRRADGIPRSGPRRNGHGRLATGFYPAIGNAAEGADGTAIHSGEDAALDGAKRREDLGAGLGDLALRQL